MLQTVTACRRSPSAYEGIAPEAVIEQLRERARSLRGARILHVNATLYGGGVSELLRSIVPLLRDLDLHVDWKLRSLMCHGRILMQPHLDAKVQ